MTQQNRQQSSTVCEIDRWLSVQIPLHSVQLTLIKLKTYLLTYCPCLYVSMQVLN